MSEPLTVLIPCKDEIRNIGDCIESVSAIADEVLIADSGSTDGTLDVVRGLGCRVIQREYIHSGDFKNWAIPQATHDWVLIVDADERVSPQLADEIKDVLAHIPDADGFWIYRENYFLGRRIRFSGWGSDCVLRLFRRDLGRYVGDTDHAEVEVSTNRTARLRHRLTHFTYRSYDQYMSKFQRYTTHQAACWQARGRKPSFWKLLSNGPLRFLHSYFFRLGFLDGWAGLQVCMLTGFYSFMKQARLWELEIGARQSHLQEQPTERTAA